MTATDDLVRLLPTPMFERAALMREAMAAAATEVEPLRTTIHAIRSEMHPQTALSFGLDRWEAELGMPTDARLSVAQRVSRLMGHLLAPGTATAARVRAIAAGFEYGAVDVIEDFVHYEVTIRFVDVGGLPPRIDEVVRAVKTVLPAHLALRSEAVYTTWDELDAAHLTWDDFDALNLTWDDILTHRFTHVRPPGVGGIPADPNAMLWAGVQQPFIPSYTPSVHDFTMLGSVQPPSP